MTRILLLSDTHNFLDEKILKYAESCDQIWHAGDIGTIKVTDELKKIKPVRAVYGNIDGMDIRKEFPLHNRFKCENVDVWITHIAGSPGRYNPEVRNLLEVKTPKLFLDEWWDNLKSAHSEKTWSLRSIGCFILFLFFLGVFLTSKKIINKQFGFWLGIIFFVCTAFSFSIARSSYQDITSHDTAVILSSSAEIKNAPAESGTKLFILHEGAKVFTTETNGDWVRIELTTDKIGWVKKSQIEFI